MREVWSPDPRHALYQAKREEALACRTGEPLRPLLPQEGTLPVLPTVHRAPEALRSTAGLPGLPATILASVGKMPFVPPPCPATSRVKTVESRAVPGRVGGQTMALDKVQQGPTPTMPLVGSSGSQGVAYLGAESGRLITRTTCP